MKNKQENMSGMFRSRVDVMDGPKRQYDPMADTANPLRIARVNQLRELYITEQRLEWEVSPFDDGSADMDKFLEKV